MRIDIITVLPELLESPFGHSILKRAKAKGLLDIHLHNLRDHTPYRQGQVDDYQFGGGAGMVMMPEPLAILIDKLKEERTYDEVIYMTPDGKVFDQKAANTLSMKQNVIILCGHYKGIDDRVRQLYVTSEISIGDYVLSGGELAAAVVVDEAEHDVGQQDGLLAPPVFTRPADFRGMVVPDVLLSGNPKLVEEWRYDQSLKRTQDRRPDLLKDDLV